MMKCPMCLENVDDLMDYGGDKMCESCVNVERVKVDAMELWLDMAQNKNNLVDEADLGLTHREITKAIWSAKLSTQFIRKHFPLNEGTDQEGQIRRFYLISKEGINAITPYI